MSSRQHHRARPPRSVPARAVLLATLASLAGCVEPGDDSAIDIADEALVLNPTSLVLNDQVTAFDLGTGVERDFSVFPIRGDGRSIVVALQPVTGDADLYVGWDTNLSRSSYACGSVAGGQALDSCVLTVPNDGVQRTLYVKSYGYAAARTWLRVYSAPASGRIEVNGASRSYTIPGDGQWYYLDFIVAGAIKRAVLSAEPLTGNNLSISVENCFSDKPDRGLERCEFAGTGTAHFVRGYFRSTSGVTVAVKVEGTDRLFPFPLPNQTPATTKINSVVDHQLGRWYVNDQKVVSAWGEVGESIYGDWEECYAKSDGGTFNANGNYTGAGHPSNLCYDGHPGLDLRAGTGTNILAMCDGTVRWPSSDPVNGTPSSFNTIYVDCGDGWTTWILHASWRVAAGTTVHVGDVVARVGEAVAPNQPHLHVEIRRYGIPVDPYGWRGVTGDPMWIVPAVGLWQ